MKLIIGLGNPGKEYEETRHNLGFAAADHLQEKWNFSPWKLDKKNESLVAPGVWGKEKVLLIKPQTFMNRSGEAVRKIVFSRKVSHQNILVIHDELDLPLNKIRISFGRSSAGHKGVESISLALGTKDYWRIRIGIDGSRVRADAEKFVLGRWNSEEKRRIKNILEEVQKMAEDFLKK